VTSPRRRVDEHAQPVDQDGEEELRPGNKMAMMFQRDELETIKMLRVDLSTSVSKVQRIANNLLRGVANTDGGCVPMVGSALTG
jgi:hypothetical protein